MGELKATCSSVLEERCPYGLCHGGHNGNYVSVASHPPLGPPPPPGHGRQPVSGTADPGVVKQGKSSGGSVDTTKTRSDPQRVRMSSGERPIGAAKGKQSNTEALCQPPPSPDQSDHRGKKRTFPLGKSDRAIFGQQTFGPQTPQPRALLEGRGVASPPPPNAPPSTLPEGTSAIPIPPPPAFRTASDCPPTDFTARPNRFVTALSLPPERPPLQANPCPSPCSLLMLACAGARVYVVSTVVLNIALQGNDPCGTYYEQVTWEGSDSPKCSNPKSNRVTQRITILPVSPRFLVTPPDRVLSTSVPLTSDNTGRAVGFSPCGADPKYAFTVTEADGAPVKVLSPLTPGQGSDTH